MFLRILVCFVLLHWLRGAPAGLVGEAGGAAGVTLRATEAKTGAATASAHPPVVGRIGNRIAMLAWWWHIVAIAVIAAAVIGVAYQTHPAYDIAIGNRVQDDPLVTDFNAAEQQPAAVGGPRIPLDRRRERDCLPRHWSHRNCNHRDDGGRREPESRCRHPRE